MRFKPPNNDNNYHWTNHCARKMMQYGLSEARIKQVLRNPKRTEEGIAENTVAVMQPASLKRTGGKETWSREIWVMYQNRSPKLKVKGQNDAIGTNAKKIIITAWRYPGKSPVRSEIPIPRDILDDLALLSDQS